MCWIGQTDKEKMLRVAGRNIHVKKVLKKRCVGGHVEYFSPMSRVYTHKDFTYKVGCDYKTQMEMEISETNGKYLYGKRGFHSCGNVWKVKANKTMYWCSCLASMNVVKSVDIYDALCDFVIPKGSQYYLNHHGEYISDRLRFVGESKEVAECTQMSTKI